MSTEQPYAHAAALYVELGWVSPVPLGRAGEVAKAPVPKGYTGRGAKVPTAAEIETWASNGYAGNNVGLHLGADQHVIGVDVDHYGDKHGGDVLAALEAKLGVLPATAMSSARDDGISGIRFFRLPEGVTELKVTKLAGGIEIIQPKHRYAVVWPSVHPELGTTYQWRGTGTGRVLRKIPSPEKLPELPEPWLAFFMDGGEVVAGAAGVAMVELTSTEVREWLAEHGAGRACRAVRGVLRKRLADLDQAAEDGTSRYDTAVEGSWALIELAVEAHPGVKDALTEFGKHYRELVRAEPDRDPTEWARMVTMGVAKAATQLDALLAEDEFAAELHPDGQCPEREEGLWPGPNAPLDVARRFIELRYTAGPDTAPVRTLRRWRGDFYVWNGQHFEVRTEEALRVELGSLLSDVEFFGAGAQATRLRWNPTPQKLAAVLGMLPAVDGVFRANDLNPDGQDGGIVVLSNGVLDVSRRELAEHSPERFVLHALPYPYSPTAKAPEWAKFLRSLWPDDDEQIALLQEWFGYVVSGDVSLQKMLLLIGPTRSGKGVITRVLEALLGREACCSVSLDAFGQNFGLASAVGRSLITVPDARFDGRGQAAVVERLLTISGNDSISVDRKNRERWEGRLGARVMVITNELPMLHETSGALVGRFVGPCETEQSWLGNEDTDIERRVMAELSGVFRWAMQGYARLVERNGGRFTEPASARSLRREWTDLNAPVMAFVNQACRLASDAQVETGELYEAYCQWAREHGRTQPSDARFGRDLRSTLGRSIDTQRLRRGNARTYVYVGIALREDFSSAQL